MVQSTRLVRSPSAHICEGYLLKRSSPAHAMSKHYCVLVGARLYSYANEEDGKSMVNLKEEMDLIGVQQWDGRGRAHVYLNCFMFVTANGFVTHASAPSDEQMKMWVREIQLGVEGALMGSNQLSKDTVPEIDLTFPPPAFKRQHCCNICKINFGITMGRHHCR